MNLSSQCHDLFPRQERKNATTAPSEAAAAVAPRGCLSGTGAQVTWPPQHKQSATCHHRSQVCQCALGSEHTCCWTPAKSPLTCYCVNIHTHLSNHFAQNSPWGTACFSHKHLHSLLLIIICYFTHISLLLVSSHFSKPRKEATA